MSEPIPEKFAKSDPNKLDLILLTLQRVQEDLLMAKCEIKTAVREVATQQSYIGDTVHKFRRDFQDINERLHGLELSQQRANSST